MSARVVPVTRRVWSLAVVLTLWVVIGLPLILPSYRCPTAALTHRPCPGCGMTRAMLLLFKGDFGASFAMHALALPTSLAYAAFALTSVTSAWRAGAPWAVFEDKVGRRVLYALMGVMMLVFFLWLARSCGAFGGPVPV